MKKLILSLSFILFIDYAFGQVKTGDVVPDIKFQLLNAPVKSATLGKLKGKIVFIEFWATWCSPCVEAMRHLVQLQTKYRNKIQIITVTDEKEARIRQFLSSRPSNLWFAIDTGELITQVFPHRVIPHTVVISPDGKLIANTTPESITALVIDSLLQQKEVHLVEKKEILLTPPDIIKKYFFAADTVKSRFVMQAEMKGAGSFSTTHLHDSTFNGRRLTCLNFRLNSLYRMAYHNFPYGRTIDKTGEKNNGPLYCVDLIVPDEKDLLPTLGKELAKRFDLQAKLMPETKEVNVLKIADTAKFKHIPINKSGKRTYLAKHGEIDEQYITMTDLADYLENYGTGKLPVIDETQNKGFFDIKFSFQPEKPESLTTILSNMGLSLEKATRKVDFLVLYK
ncbi:redoxin family protein [Mucilaginibacter sp. NFX135]|uniref:redoxin family protein n=1 Tax=Mucilaginibacter sp. NFX135 TaxID=3402687 RepID=UPI003AFB4F91